MNDVFRWNKVSSDGYRGKKGPHVKIFDIWLAVFAKDLHTRKKKSLQPGAGHPQHISQ